MAKFRPAAPGNLNYGSNVKSRFETTARHIVCREYFSNRAIQFSPGQEAFGDFPGQFPGHFVSYFRRE
jgi:hypothetical protein